MKIGIILKITIVIFLAAAAIFLLVKSIKKCKSVFNQKINKKAHKKYLEEKAKVLQKQQQTQLQKQNQIENIEYYNQNSQYIDDDEKIVGIVKPIGKWTELIFKQKFTYLNALRDFLSQQQNNPGEKKKGFWQIMLEAKSQTQGRYQGKDRGR